MAFSMVAVASLLVVSMCFLALLKTNLEFASSGVSRALQDTDGESLLVSFVGLENNDRNEWAEVDGIAQSTLVLRRPSWHKTTRCSDDSSESCEECWSSTNCWSPNSDSRVVQSDSGPWQRFISSIHVRCPLNAIDIHYEVHNVRNGHLRFLWDGVEISSENSFIDYVGDFRQRAEIGMQRLSDYNQISVDSVGGHLFQVEFISFGHNSGAELTTLEMTMPETYVHCEDFKVCLDPLRAGDEGLQMLRNNNRMQLACLEASSFDGACALWRGCLASEKQQSLLHLLRAALIDEFPLDLLSEPSTGPSNSSPSPSSGPRRSQASSDVLCVDPAIEDAESWNCDCHDEMRRTCAEIEVSEQVCLRVLMCEHESVCGAWKHAARCDVDAEILAVRDQMHNLRRLSGALVARKSSGRALLARREVESLDRALGTKRCQ